MSGFCGVVHHDGAPLPGGVLRDLTSFLDFRGPDAQGEWFDAAAGLGHAMLRTTPESRDERQPTTLDGRAWIVADARIDARRELAAALAGAGHSPRRGATDAELILHAWAAWGETCVARLVGDFAFAIWDARTRRLFCARDHFGVKPFYYAHAGSRIVFSNTLDCVRRHPAVSARLDDLAIADFLLFDRRQDPAATAFADIRRLPPAHALAASADGVSVRRYWSLPEGAEVRYRAAGDYVERFRELLDAAVGDRLRTRRVAVSMSGGLDSSSIAATAKGLLESDGPYELHAHTGVYDRVIPDRERHYAGIAAAHLRVPIHFHAGDDYRIFERLPEQQFPEPFHEPDGGLFLDVLKAQASHARVLLTGWDGDALLNESPKPYLRALIAEGRYARAFGGAIRYAISQRRIVPIAWRERLTRRRVPPTPGYPAWLNPDFEKRLELRERWERAQRDQPPAHPIRPYAHRIYAYIQRLSGFFDRYDAGWSRLPLDCRHPLIDLRLIDYCLSLPPLPWCVKKHILREAMRGALPAEILGRPKTALAGVPGFRMLEPVDAQWIDRFVPAAPLLDYVVRAKIPRAWSPADPQQAWVDLRPLSLNAWLQGLQSSMSTTRGRLHESIRQAS